jgi:hypothetical protein
MRPLSFAEAFSLQRTLQHGVLAVRLALGPMWLGGLLMLMGDGCNPGSLADLMPSDDEREALLTPPGGAGPWRASAAAAQRGFDLPPGLTTMVIGALIAIVVVALVFSLLMFAFGCYVSTGFARMHVGILEREDDTLGPLFSGSDRFWSMAGYKGLAGLLLSAAFLVSAWPGAVVAGYGYLIDREVWMIGGAGLAALLVVPVVCYVALGTFFGEHAVALDGMRALPALRRSWQLAAGNRWPMLGFVIVCALLQMVSAIGLIACCVGALATMPLARAVVGFAKTEGYLLFTRGRAEAGGWKLWQRDAGGPSAGPGPHVPPAEPASAATPGRAPAARAAPVASASPVAKVAPAQPAASGALPPTRRAEPAAPPSPSQPHAPEPPQYEPPRYEPPPGFGSLPSQPSSETRPQAQDDPAAPPRDPRKR